MSKKQSAAPITKRAMYGERKAALHTKILMQRGTRHPDGHVRVVRSA